MNTKYSCGGCTACCTTHGVLSIQKQPHTPCPSCTQGGGCNIYEHRPNECQDFTCSWILGNGGGPERRPDKTGIVPVHKMLPEAGLVLNLSEYRQGALHSEFVFNWTRRNLLSGNLTVHYKLTGKVRLYLPKGEEHVTEETHHFFEEKWGKKAEFISFKDALQGLIL